MKIIIKNKLQTIEEARTFQDAITNLGNFKKKLINILRTLGEEQPEQLSDEIIDNLKNSIPDKYEGDEKTYDLLQLGLDGDRVAVFDWLKNLTINNKSNLIAKLSRDVLSPDVQRSIAKFILAKKKAKLKNGQPVKDIRQLEDLQDLDTVTDRAYWEWYAAEKYKEYSKSSSENIEVLTSSDPNWSIFLPHDRQGAVYLGNMCSDTWCTSSRSEWNKFSNYYRKNDPIFILKHKTQKEQAVVKNPQTHQMETIEVPLMYQGVFGKYSGHAMEFKDRKNHEVDRETRDFLIKLIQNSKTSDGKPVQEKYPVVNAYNTETTEDGLLEHFRRFKKLFL